MESGRINRSIKIDNGSAGYITVAHIRYDIKYRGGKERSKKINQSSGNSSGGGRRRRQERGGFIRKGKNRG